MTYFETAVVIGRQITDAAIWHDGRCTWVGAMPEQGTAGLRMTYTSFGPDLYGGSAGVALTLAELHAASGEPIFRTAALGGIEHALSRVDDLPPGTSGGIYTGRLGVAVAAARIGWLLGRAILCERGAALGRDLGPCSEPTENDLLSGRAGTIIGLLTLNAITGEGVLVQKSAEIGEQLTNAGVREAQTLSWPSPSLPGQPGLTGFSHGTAGIGYALLELYRATGDHRFRAATEGAFRYEHGLYNADAKNWPDLRDIATPGTPSDGGPTYALQWCHGAPGIALSRMRATELLDDAQYRSEAVTALETTRDTVRAELHTGNYSLCHGLAGNAEILIEGEPLLGGESGSLARSIALAGIQTYSLPGRSWPGGVPGGHTASLFLGLAGTAYFYLRLNNPTIPSVLLIRPEQFASLVCNSGRPRTRSSGTSGEDRHHGLVAAEGASDACEDGGGEQPAGGDERVG
jgi:lantibiotic modifying enzyme